MNPIRKNYMMTNIFYDEYDLINDSVKYIFCYFCHFMESEVERIHYSINVLNDITINRCNKDRYFEMIFPIICNKSLYNFLNVFVPHCYQTFNALFMVSMCYQMIHWNKIQMNTNKNRKVKKHLTALATVKLAAPLR